MKGSVPGSALFDFAAPARLAVALCVEVVVVVVPVEGAGVAVVDGEDVVVEGAAVEGAVGVDGVVPVDGAGEVAGGVEERDGGGEVEVCVDVASGSMYCWSAADDPEPPDARASAGATSDRRIPTVR